MIKIKTYTSKRDRIRNIHLIYNSDPASFTYASSLLLKSFYFKLELKEAEANKANVKLLKKGNNRLYRIRKMTFSRNYLRQQLKEKGDLVCAYCGKNHLVIEEEGMRVKYDIMATTDHFVPISKGGALEDLNNLKVACWHCNHKKKNMMPDQFMQQFNIKRLHS